MRVLHVVAILCGVLTSAHGQTLPNSGITDDLSPTVLKATVQSFEIESKTPFSVDLTVRLKMSIVNTGPNPIIFLRTYPPEIRGWSLAESKEALSKSDLIDLVFFGESVDRSSKWLTLRRALDRPLPPANQVNILQPNEMWTWLETANLSLPKTDADKRYPGYSESESWERVKRLPSIWLLPICSVWPMNLEKPNRKSGGAENPFGRKLQKRWKEVGLLLMDVTIANPIKLDMNTATIR
jgi:hypothetical protein